MNDLIETSCLSLSIERGPSPGEGEIEAAGQGGIEVRRYIKADGWVTRYWAVYIGEKLLVVCLYKKGARAVADLISQMNQTTI